MAVAAGCFFSLVIAEDGRLFASGNNTNGCLADGSRAHQGRFVSVEAGELRFSAVAAGMQHVLALDERGGLWAWGSNYHGQLGLGPALLETLRPAPVPLGALGGLRVHAVAAGLAHCLLSAGAAGGAGGAGGGPGLRLFAAGCNTEGQLGTGDFAPRSEFVPVLDGGDPRAPCRAAPGRGALAVGGWHSLAVDPAGRLWTWGSLVGTQPLFAPDGSLGRAQPAPCAFHPDVFGGERVRAVAAGHCHTLALTDTAVWSHGDAHRGCLGHGAPAAPAPGHDTPQEPLWGPGLALPARVEALAGLGVSAVACGPYHNLALARGRVFAWGMNSSGQLGLGDLADRDMPALVPPGALGHQRVAEVAVGVEHGCALTEGGVLYTFGRSRAGGARPPLPCGLGVASVLTVQPSPMRVAVLFERKPSGARLARLGRWHGVSVALALAWLLGTLPPRAAGSTGYAAATHRRSARLAARAQARRCWVAALPADVARIILDQCRGRHGWFAGDM
jgi:alpha-tubulin suppressor-like RCC1 family protein